VPVAVIRRELGGRTALETLTILRACPADVRHQLLGAVEEPLRSALAGSIGVGASPEGKTLYDQFIGTIGELTEAAD
jgi:hypothetical protein